MGIGKHVMGAQVLLFSWLAQLVVGQSLATPAPSVSFAYPPAESSGKPRLTINVLDTVNVEWNSNFGQTWLYLWCDEFKNEDGGKKITYKWLTKEVFASGDTSYSPWDALEADTNNRTGKYPYACHFDLIYSNESQKGITGPNLFITSRAGETVATTFGRRATEVGTTAAPTSSSLSSILTVSSFSTTASAAIETTSSSSSPTATPLSSASAAPSTDGDGLSTGAKAGIGVGAVFAVLVIAAIGFLFYRNHRKLKELESRAYPQELHVEPKTATTEYYRQDYQSVPPSELEHQHQHAYELPAQPQEMSGVESAKKQ